MDILYLLYFFFPLFILVHTWSLLFCLHKNISETVQSVLLCHTFLNGAALMLLVNLISFTEATKHGTLLWHQQKYVNLSLWIITSRFFILQKKVSGASEWCMVYSCKCDLTRSGTMTDLQCIPEKQRQLVRNALSTQM